MSRHVASVLTSDACVASSCVLDTLIFLKDSRFYYFFNSTNNDLYIYKKRKKVKVHAY